MPDQPAAASFLSTQIAHLRAGTHVCLVYGSAAQQLATLIPFLTEGRTREERSVYIDSAPNLTHIAEALGDSQPDIQRGQLCLLTWEEAYFRGGRFDPDAMLHFIRSLSGTARDQGWANLRVAGEMTWALEPNKGGERLLDYEARLEEVIAALGIRVICQYDERRFPDEVIQHVLRSHAPAIVGEHVYDNPYFDPSRRSRAPAPSATIMLDNLRLRTARANALAELAASAASVSMGEVASAAAQIISHHTGAEVVEVLEVRGADKTVARLASFGLRDDASPPSLPAAASAVPPTALVVPDWAEESRFPGASKSLGRNLTSSIGVPIKSSGDEVIGMLWAHSAKHRIVTEDDFAFVETVAAVLGEAMARLQAENELRSLLESLTDLIARFDRDLRLVYVNSAVERVLAQPAAALLGKTSREVGLREPLAQLWDVLVQQVWRTGREQATEFPVVTAAGERHFHSRIVPEFDRNGTIRSVLAIAHDVTDQRSAEAERSAAYREMVSQQARLTELLSRLEHDHDRALQRTAYAIRAEQLTDRERAILELLVRGWTNREIAAELELRPGTVKNHVQKILVKLDVSDRTQAAVRAVELGLASPA